MKKLFMTILKIWLRNRDECIGSFHYKGKKYCIYVAEYGTNSSSYQENLKTLLNSSENESRWKKAFIKL
ncbi:MAG: hypothetical protein HFI43_12805 [Lachnospiraceae bacterium]|jgi:hypothetical protein|nr:hypothetical protein [Lachnospiraceae bacterium]